MDDYLMRFGFSPQEMGIDRLLQTDQATSAAVHSQRERESEQRHSQSGGTSDRERRFDNVKLKDLPLTMAYVPFQQLKETYNQEEALKSGTLFPELDKPFLGRRP